MGSGTKLVDKKKLVVALHATVPSSTVPKWVSLKGYNHVTAIVSYKNGASGITPVVITLQQATAVAGTGAKALPFTTVFTTIGDAASAVLTSAPVTANAITIDATPSTNGVYIIEIDSWQLDVANKFNSFQVATANGVAQTLEITYVLDAPARFSGEMGSFTNPLTD